MERAYKPRKRNLELTRNEKGVIYYRHIVKTPYSMRRIGKMLDLSAERIRVIEYKAIEKLYRKRVLKEKPSVG